MNTKLKNSMTMTTKSTHLADKLSRIAATSALALTLSACGESDLTQIHDDEIRAAAQQSDEAELLLGAGTPESTPEATPESASEETSETAPESTPEETSETTPESAPEESAESTPESVPEETAEATSEVPAPSAATRSAIDVDDFELVFNDEFNVGELDDSKWNTAMAWGPDFVINDEQQFYVDTQSNPDSEFNPFSFDGEALIISADNTPESLSATASGQDYVSGTLTTLNKFDLSYGYIEARVDVPEGAGLWPALWMLGTEFVDLKPQLFMMEYNGSNPNSFFHNYNYTDAEGNLRSPMQHEVVVNGASEGWQTIGVRWSVGELIYYINGFPTFQVNGENVASQAMYLIMNLAVGGIWVDTPDDTTEFPAQFKVDYIRAYQLK